ncbi:MAG: hypothetical protein IJU83_04390 [Clostridia bacterium]|nr:hypothetical protein [Clostridia bacterium]
MSKKFTLFLAIVAFIFCFYALYSARTPAFAAYAEKYELYFETGSKGRAAVYADKKDFFVFSGIKGESCSISVSYERILKDFNAKHLFTEKTDEGEIYYAFTDKLPYAACVRGKTVNIQYFAGADYNKVGTPLIFGSF